MLTLTKEEISNAPAEVQSWIAEALGLTAAPQRITTPAGDRSRLLQESPAESKADPEPAEQEAPPSMEDVLNQARVFMKTKEDGKAKFKAILDEMGLSRAKECPEDRLAELLSKVAVA